MIMTPCLRKFALVVHIVFSVGWIGTLIPYLALTIAGLTSRDTQMVRAAYLSIELIGWFVIVPFGFAALLSGLVQSLGTRWGLFRYWWVVAKLVLTFVAVIVLVKHMQTVSQVARLAAEETLFGADFRAVQIQLLIHPSGGLLVLLLTMALSVFKPWGLTPSGRHRASEFTFPDRRRDDGLPFPARESVLVSRRMRWGRVIGIHAMGITLLLVVVLHLTGGFQVH